MMSSPHLAARLMAQEHQHQSTPYHHHHHQQLFHPSHGGIVAQAAQGAQAALAGLPPSSLAPGSVPFHPGMFPHTQQQPCHHRPQPHQQQVYNNYYGQFGPFHSQFAQIFINNSSGSNNNSSLPEDSGEKKIILQPPNAQIGIANRNKLALVRKPRNLGEALAAEASKSRAIYRNEAAKKVTKLHFCGQVI